LGQSLTGFTLLELIIASALLVIAVSGIAIIYTTSNNFLHLGIAKIDAQGKLRIAGERICRWIRPGKSVVISGGGDAIQIETLNSVSPIQWISSSIYYNNGKIYYDSNIDDGTPASLVIDNVCKISGIDIFAQTGNLVSINFGVTNEYEVANAPSTDISLEVKLRGAE